ncbi:ferritin-like domain-containing protein [Luteolibacter sp. Populi]|uniref:ferritin-like domain-containing protein n=1 Tax=Luteolibacter sp. Populi TaxID=3230487 RepID=UPI0034679C87
MNTTSDSNTPASQDTVAGRRKFLMSLGLGAGAAALATQSASADPKPAPYNKDRRVDASVLNFALNLEYLEAEYYLYATTGLGLEAAGIGTDGRDTEGQTIVKPNPKVNFATPAIAQYANEIAIDEANHVRFLREAIDSSKYDFVARPKIDLLNSFNTLGTLLGLPSFDPFANEVNFLLGAFVFEDVGVTAYKGSANKITNKGFLEAAAGILGVEAYHAGTVRLLLNMQPQSVKDLVNKISDIRASLDGQPANAPKLDQGITLNGAPNLVPTDGNSVAFSRTPRQVLNIVYGGVNAKKGLFFPDGLNGEIR